MGRSGGGLFDSDSVWDLADQLSRIAKVDLSQAGITDFPRDEDNPPIMTVKDTAKHMNKNGWFDIIFNLLKERESTYSLIIFTALNMKVGTKIKRKHINYLKKVYADIEDFEHLPESREQVRCALEEYKSGEPYTFLDKECVEENEEQAISEEEQSKNEKAEETADNS